MSRRSCLVLHRRSASDAAVEAVVEEVRSGGVDLRVRIPWDGDDVARVVREAVEDGAETVVAGGGDGTVNSVAAALLGDDGAPPPAALGVFPVGTANDFARGCDLPLDDLAACLRIASTGEPRAVDVGRVNGTPFLNVASGGFGAEITAATPEAMKRALGPVAYTLAGVARATRLRPYSGTLTVPGEEPVSAEMLFMAVGNNRFAGGGIEVAPERSLDDGLLDLAMVTTGPDAPLLKLVEELRDPAGSDHRYLYYRQLSDFTLNFAEEVHVNLDGEPMVASRFEFSVVSGGIEVVY